MMARADRALWVFAGLLAASVAAEWALPGTDGSPPPPPAPMLRGAAGTPPGQASSVWAAGALDRPLFTPGRRPDATGSQAAGSTGHTEPPRLTGIVVSAAGRRAIFDQHSASGDTTVVAEGGRLGAWRVDAIHDSEVQLSGPDGPRRVRLSYSGEVSAPTAPNVPGVLLPPVQRADTKPPEFVTMPAGPPTLLNAPVPPVARTPP